MVRILAVALLLSTLPGCMLASLPIWSSSALPQTPGVVTHHNVLP